MLKGRIIKNISNTYTVLSNHTLYECTPRGKFRNVGLTPLVGDEVEFDEEHNYILNILPRKNVLERPSISNITHALIVTSLKNPDLSLNLLDKEISSIILAGITPVICFTKLDLVESETLKELASLRKYYEKINIKTFTNKDLESLVKFLKNKYVVLTGQTGAGKSRLIKSLAPETNISIGEVSLALGRGKHTTRHTEFYRIKDIFIADTPGFSSLDLTKYSPEEIKNTFPEFLKYSCEYRDCNHLKEPYCGVKEAYQKGEILKSRYENYCNFLSR